MEYAESDCTDDGDMDIYGGLGDLQIVDDNDETSKNISQTKDNTSANCLLKESVDIATCNNYKLIIEQDKKDLGLIHEQMLLYDELLVAENTKRREREEQEKVQHESLIQENLQLKEANKCLQEKNNILHTENANLKLNISSLYKTSKAEIAHKDSLIADFQAELNRLIFQRHSFQRKGGSFTPTSKTEESKCANNDKFRKSTNFAKVSRSNHKLTKQTLEASNSSKRKPVFSEESDTTPEPVLLPDLVEESGPCNSQESTQMPGISSKVDCTSKTNPISVVPTELQEALAKFEEQQAASLNSLKRSFSEYAEKQGCLTGELKETVTDFYTSKPKHKKSANKVEHEQQKINSVKDDSSIKTNKNSVLCTPVLGQCDGEEAIESNYMQKKYASRPFSDTKLQTLYQKRQVARWFPNMKRSKNDDEDFSSESDSENQSSDYCNRKRRHSHVRKASKFCSPLKCNQKSKPKNYLKARNSRLAHVKPLPHRTPDKFPTPLKNDVLKIFHYQSQPVPYAVKRKLGLLENSVPVCQTKVVDERNIVHEHSNNLLKENDKEHQLIPQVSHQGSNEREEENNCIKVADTSCSVVFSHDLLQANTSSEVVNTITSPTSGEKTEDTIIDSNKSNSYNISAAKNLEDIPKYIVSEEKILNNTESSSYECAASFQGKIVKLNNISDPIEKDFLYASKNVEAKNECADTSNKNLDGASGEEPVAKIHPNVDSEHFCSADLKSLSLESQVSCDNVKMKLKKSCSSKDSTNGRRNCNSKETSKESKNTDSDDFAKGGKNCNSKQILKKEDGKKCDSNVSSKEKTKEDRSYKVSGVSDVSLKTVMKRKPSHSENSHSDHHKKKHSSDHHRSKIEKTHLSSKRMHSEKSKKSFRD